MSDTSPQSPYPPVEGNGARRQWQTERDVDDLKREVRELRADVKRLLDAEDRRADRERLDAQERSRRQQSQDRERSIVVGILVAIVGGLTIDQVDHALTNHQLALNLSNPLVLLGLVVVGGITAFAARHWL